MFRNRLRLMLGLLLVLAAVLVVFVTPSLAQCSPEGTAGDDIINCNGNDPNGVDTGAGNDRVNLNSGNVQFVLLKSGTGSLVIAFQGGNVVAAGSNGVITNGNSLVIIGTGTLSTNAATALGLQANNSIATISNITVNAVAFGIRFSGTGSHSLTLNGTQVNVANLDAVRMLGNGEVTGDANTVLNAGTLGSGIVIEQNGTVTFDGEISAGDFGIFIGGNGGVTLGTTAFVDADGDGVRIEGAAGGNVTNNGTVFSDATGIVILNNGLVTNNGDVSADDIGILIDGNGEVVNSGSVFSLNDTGIAIFFNGTVSTTDTSIIDAGLDGIYIGGNGQAFTSGIIFALANGIVILGNGNVVNDADIFADNFGIQVGVVGDDTASAFVDNAGFVNTIDTAVIINGTGTVFNSGQVVSLGDIGVAIITDGNVNNSGTITGGLDGVLIGGTGAVNNTGGIGGATGYGVLLFNGGTVNNSAEATIEGGTGGVLVYINGQVNNSGSITTTAGFAVAVENGEVNNQAGALIDGGNGGVTMIGGTVNNNGTVNSSNGPGIIIVMGTVNNTSVIEVRTSGIIITNSGTVNNTGTITTTTGDGIFIGGNGEVRHQSGTINAGFSGIAVLGDGRILTDAPVTGATGIEGGAGNQEVIITSIVTGTAADALNMGGGNDSVLITQSATINGDVQLGEGDDIAQVEIGATVNGTLIGGTGGETIGDQLILGSANQEFCLEGSFDPARVRTEISALNPALGMYTVDGRTYSFAEFENIRPGFASRVCFPFINDGRINAYDLAAPVALYCTSGGGLAVYEINETTGQGTLSFQLSGDEMRAGRDTALANGTNVLLGSDGFGTQVYALSSGQFQVNSPDTKEPFKTYTFIYSAARCNTVAL